MKRSLLVSAVLTALIFAPALSRAQPAEPLPDTAPLREFLESRVFEELAAEGTVLARLGLAVRLELTGDEAEVR